jgi:hypothetical protein
MRVGDSAQLRNPTISTRFFWDIADDDGCLPANILKERKMNSPSSAGFNPSLIHR